MPQVLIDALSGREVLAGPEEQNATQPLIHYLTQKLGWHPGQLMAHPQWRVPRAPSASRAAGFPVDLAIFDSPDRRGDPDHIRIIAECKAPDEEKGITQLKTYLRLEPDARLGIWFNGQSHALVYHGPDGFTVNRYAPIPRPTDPLAPSAIGKRPLRFGDLVPPPNLRETFVRLREQIAAQDSHVNRDEFILNDLANMLICKIADEQAGELDPERPMAFQVTGSTQTTGHAIRAFFDETKNRLRSVFTDGSDRLHVDDVSLETIVRSLQPYRILGHDRHAVGTAFQVLRGRALRGDEGAYFTPAPLVDCVISILDPDHTDRVIDPACGTGGFLAAALDHVYGRIDARPRVGESAKARAKREWAADNLFAVDKDAVSIRLCKAYLTLLGDGRSHAYRADTIDRRDWGARDDDLIKVVAEKSFTVGITNPPFGKKLKVTAETGRKEDLLTCRKWKLAHGQWEPTDEWIEQQLGIVFFERCMRLLKPGGRLAIVLPETFLFSKGFRWFVDWICRTNTVTHVVDVPMVAFEEFCRAKTCLLFVTKQEPSAGHSIVMSFPRTIGQDGDGKPLLKRNASGERTGDLDNEIAEAVKQIVSASYDGDLPRPAPAKQGETRLRFHVRQSEVQKHGVLVPRYWWRRDTDKATRAWMKRFPASTMVTLGELVDRGILRAFDGHGSPKKTERATGSIPYVKVTDIKNWRIVENPSNFIHESAAKKMRRGKELHYGDIVTPARASKNIGQFSLVLPWQTNIVLTKEVLVLRTSENDEAIDTFLLLPLLSLNVVLAQYENLALMQVNREHLGDSWKQVVIPLPDRVADRRKIAEPIRRYFDAIVQARSSYDEFVHTFERSDFGTGP